jgi:hypothetical protein
MNETHTTRMFEELELELAWPIDIPPVKWLNPTPPAEVLSLDSRWAHFPITY